MCWDHSAEMADFEPAVAGLVAVEGSAAGAASSAKAAPETKTIRAKAETRVVIRIGEDFPVKEQSVRSSPALKPELIRPVGGL